MPIIYPPSILWIIIWTTKKKTNHSDMAILKLFTTTIDQKSTQTNTHTHSLFCFFILILISALMFRNPPNSANELNVKPFFFFGVPYNWTFRISLILADPSLQGK